jgi:transcriptional regulator GlxA family with amidase domain
MPTRRVGILIFDDVEALDFAGPFEVFSMASAIAPASDPRPFEVLLIAEEDRPYRASGGIPGIGFRLHPDWTFSSCPALDVVVAPGGAGTRVEDKNDRSLSWLKGQARTAEVMTSVCTGAFLLAACGLLNGRRATTHFRQVGRFRESYPVVQVVEGVRWVEDGAIISSAGVSAGIDMSLHVVARLLDEDWAKRTARAMQYEGAWSQA